MDWIRKKGRTRSKSSIKATGAAPLTKTKSESSMLHKLRKSTSTYDFFKSKPKSKSKSKSKLKVRHRRSSSEGPPPSSVLSSRFEPPKDMLGNMTEKFVTRQDKGTVWIDLPRLCHKFRVIDARLTSEGPATVGASVGLESTDMDSSTMTLSTKSGKIKSVDPPGLSEVQLVDDDSGHPLDGKLTAPLSTREASLSPVGFPEKTPVLAETLSADRASALETHSAMSATPPSKTPLPSLVQSTTDDGITVIGPETWHNFVHTPYFDGTVPQPVSSPIGRRGGKNVVSAFSSRSSDDDSGTGIRSMGIDMGTVTEDEKAVVSTSEGSSSSEETSEVKSAVDQLLAVEDEKKKEESMSLNMSVDDEETMEEQCTRLWKHWEIICKLLRELTSLCDDFQDMTGSMMSLSEQLDEQIRKRSAAFRLDHRYMANCDFPSVLSELFDDSPSLSTSVVLSVLCLCTQRIVFEPVFRISREVIKTSKLSDYRGKGSWFIDITFLPKNEVRVRHRRRGAIKEDPRDKAQWAIVSWEVDMRVRIDSIHLENSRCVSRKIRITGVEFNEDCAYEFKRKWKHKLCGGSMTLP